MEVICLILLPLATARATRLIVDDAITMPLRSWVINRFGENSTTSYLVHCTWCTSVWIAALLVIPTVILLGFPIWTTPLAALATAQLAPMIIAAADRIENRE